MPPEKSNTKSKRGGLRPGAGRPPIPAAQRRGPDGLNWGKVREYARLGADRDTIVLALGVDEKRFRDPVFIAQFQHEMARGGALLKIDLLENVRALGRGPDGKVSAVLAGLKENLDWGKADAGAAKRSARPDNDNAVAELEAILRRVR